MKIFVTSITNGRIFDHDVMYTFSKIEPNHGIEMDNSNNNKLTKREIETIKKTLQIDKVTKYIEFSSMTLNGSIAPKIFDSIFSFFLIIEAIFSFIWMSQDIFATIMLVVTSMWMSWRIDSYKIIKECTNLRKYYEHRFLSSYIRGLSFFKLPEFCNRLCVAELFWRRKNRLRRGEMIKLFVDNIVHGFPEYIEESTTRLCFEEMYFDILVYTGIYLIDNVIAAQSISNWQMFAIVFRILVMTKTTLAFVAVRERIKLFNIFTKPFKNQKLILREVSYIGMFLFLNGSLPAQNILLKFFFLSTSLSLQSFIACNSSDNEDSLKNRKALISFGYKIKWINYWTIFNYSTIAYYTCLIFYLLTYEMVDINGKEYRNSYFLDFSSLGILFFISWLILVGSDRFYHPYNLMYTFWHMYNNGSIIIDENVKPHHHNIVKKDQHLIFLRKDLSKNFQTLKGILTDSVCAQYVEEIINLFTLHQYYDCEMFSSKDFLQKNNAIFKHLRTINLKHFDEFIEHQLTNKSMEIKTEINGKWSKLKEFIKNEDNGKENPRQSSSDDFITFLNFLIINKGDFRMNQHIGESTKTLRKRRLDFENFAKIFLCLVLDLPIYNIQLDESSPMNVKIFKISISDLSVIKEDVMYIFADNESCKFSSKDFSNFKVNAKNSKVIRETIQLDKISNCLLLTTVTEPKRNEFTQKRLIKIFTCLLSLLSVIDAALDLKLAINYWHNGDIMYCTLTLAILTIAGTVNLFINEYFMVKYSYMIKYNNSILNFLPIRCLSSFTQVSTFLKTISAIPLILKRNKQRKDGQEIELLLDNIIQGHPEYIHENQKITNFIGMIFESIPQTILQMYIVVQTNSLSTLQSFAISMSIFAMIKTTLQFVSVVEGITFFQFLNSPNYEFIKVLLREVFYIIFTTSSFSLLFYFLPLYQIVYWIIFFMAVSLSCSSSTNKEKKSLILLGQKVKLVNYWTVFNYLTILKSICYFIFLGTNIYSKDDNYNVYVNVLFMFSFSCFCIWLKIIFHDNFQHAYNFMYLPWHIKNRAFLWENTSQKKQKMNSNFV